MRMLVVEEGRVVNVVEVEVGKVPAWLEGRVVEPPTPEVGKGWTLSGDKFEPPPPTKAPDPTELELRVKALEVAR